MNRCLTGRVCGRERGLLLLPLLLLGLVLLLLLLLLRMMRVKDML